jgi:hypothetical protein
VTPVIAGRRYTLNKTWDCWSAGTEVTILDDLKNGNYLVRIKGEQVVMDKTYVTMRRKRSGTV